MALQVVVVVVLVGWLADCDINKGHTLKGRWGATLDN